MLIVGKTGYAVFDNFLYYFFKFSLNLKQSPSLIFPSINWSRQITARGNAPEKPSRMERYCFLSHLTVKEARQEEDDTGHQKEWAGIMKTSPSPGQNPPVSYTCKLSIKGFQNHNSTYFFQKIYFKSKDTNSKSLCTALTYQPVVSTLFLSFCQLVILKIDGRNSESDQDLTHSLYT